MTSLRSSSERSEAARRAPGADVGPGIRVGVDIGGTKAEAVAISPDGVVIASAWRATAHGPSGVLDTVSGVIRDLPVAADAIGIGIPGQIAHGVVRNAVNLGVEELDLGAALAAELGVPVRVENDVNAAALGAWALRGPQTGPLAYLNLGTGVAAGLVVDGRVWSGSGGVAGEVGHVSIDPAGPECPCGQRGCIETLAGGASIARRWGRGGEHPVRSLFAAADDGDPDALALRSDLARGVAAAVRVLVLTVDPSVVVIGGGLSRLGERLLSAVRIELAASASSSPFLTSLRLEDRIEVLPHHAPGGAAAGALGAALAAAPAR
ncbi:ROK family protein [Microbacterium stercoris]|uniref:ROK family protein n=1 Tax=Microbacterium stercoris TaxID=2820289 RepID=UPI0027DDB22C|nr:ROK family protein [Microbacterium stercoris]